MLNKENGEQSQEEYQKKSTRRKPLRISPSIPCYIWQISKGFIKKKVWKKALLSPVKHHFNLRLSWKQLFFGWNITIFILNIISLLTSQVKLLKTVSAKLNVDTYQIGWNWKKWTNPEPPLQWSKKQERICKCLLFLILDWRVPKATTNNKQC